VKACTGTAWQGVPLLSVCLPARMPHNSQTCRYTVSMVLFIMVPAHTCTGRIHQRSSMFVLAGSFWMCWVPHPPYRSRSSLSSTCSTFPAHNLTSCTHHLCDCRSSFVRSAVLCVCRNFLEVLGPSSPFPLPQQLQQHLQHLREQLLQDAVLRTGSVTFEVMTAGEQ
jgi:hypothetical protein